MGRCSSFSRCAEVSAGVLVWGHDAQFRRSSRCLCGVLPLSSHLQIVAVRFGPESDLDILVEFEPGHTPGFAFFGMQDELPELFGRKVDLNTPAFLSRYFRQDVLKRARVQYER